MKMTMAGHVGFMQEIRNAYDIVVRKSEGKKPLR
jgi:hypothetical protein